MLEKDKIITRRQFEVNSYAPEGFLNLFLMANAKTPAAKLLKELIKSDEKWTDFLDRKKRASMHDLSRDKTSSDEDLGAFLEEVKDISNLVKLF
ncbi:MAG: hypothetical protein U0946_02355, partial [Patescibacteria group bacterium]|nr:hypothetical protein [Patescibacteria group bacterium]